MRPFIASRLSLAFGMLALLCCTGAIRPAPAGDYEFAQRVLEDQRERTGFLADDLIERLANRLLNSSSENGRWEGRLIQALLLRHHAASSSPEKKVELLGQAEAVYTEFLKKAARHPLNAPIRQTLPDVRMDFIRALLSGEDGASSNRAEARRRAVAMVEGLLPERKSASEVAWKELAAIQLPDDPTIEIPPALLRRLGQAVEKAVIADQAYLTTWLLLIEACPGGERQAKEIQEATAFCQQRIDHERLAECDLAVALYLHLKGRAFAFLPDEARAIEAWSTALGLLPENVIDDEVARTVYPMQAAILFDYVRMKMKGSEKDPSRYEDVVRVVRGMIRTARWDEIAQLPAGKQILIDYSIALVRQPESSALETAEAFGRLREVSAGGPPWSNNAALAMAQVLAEAGPGKQPKLGAMAWYETARGCLMQGQRAFRVAQEKVEDGQAEQADADKREAFQHFEQAIAFYRRAIAVARNPEITDALTRLKIEPSAWFETGICYQKMDHLLEACAAYRALLKTFGKDGRAGWLPQQPDAKSRAKIDELLAALDQEGESGRDGLLQRAANNRKVAARRLSPQDRDRIGAGDTVTAYERGRMLTEEGRRLEEQAAGQKRSGHRDEAVNTWRLALEQYLKAAQAFSKEDAASPVRDLALYHTGYANLLAQTVLVERLGRVGAVKSELVEAQAKELAVAGLQAFNDFESHISMAQNPAPEVTERREKLLVAIRQARPYLFYNAGRLEDCVAAADECLKAERVGPTDTPRDAAVAGVLFSRYRALSRLAAGHAVPERDPFLGRARATADQLKAHDDYYRYALADLAARYFQASQDAAKRAASQPEAHASGVRKNADPVKTYDVWTAEYTWRSLKAQPEADRRLEDYSRLLSILANVHDWLRVCDAASELLKRFDPEKKNSRMADTEWPIVLRRMHLLIRYADLRKMEACRKDHTALIDYLYVDPSNEGLAEDRRPEQDRYEVDLNKAALQAGTIRRNYPDCGTLDPQQGLDGRSWLTIVEEEVDFRRRILATRDLLSEAAIEAATAVTDTKPEDAIRYRDIAREQLEILLEIWGNVPGVKLKIADLQIANRDYEGALKTLWDVKHGEPPHTDLYIKTSVQISRVYRMQGDARSAAEYPQFLLIGGPWEKFFPDIHAFLEWCYQNGAPRPVKVEPVGDGKLNYGLRTPDEVEFMERIGPAYRRGNPADLPPSVVWQYEFLKRKIEQTTERSALERFMQTRPAGGADEAIVTAARARHAVLEKLCENKTALWRLSKQLDAAIVDLGSLDRVRKENASLMADRERITREIGELEAQLKQLPEVAIGAATP